MTDTNTGTATQRLRNGTRVWHEALESTGFATAMLAGTLPLDRYVGQLAAYRVVLAALETELARALCPSVDSVWSPDLAKLPLVERDLRHFAALGPAPRPGPAAAEFAAEIRHTAATAPTELLGFLYVLEGSTLGALFLRRYVIEAYRLTDGYGTSYYGSGDRARWTALTERLDRALGEGAVQERVVAAAERAYRHVALISAELSVGLGRPAPEPV
ncbi:biliverdin-producing heme oxygenase [Streptomyces sp. MBT65]|uniref:biliverdin-producing heme oxygenase n=1 Tax=Streptomyces sp. MBT65 TaxID=1488395 RepID=UPI00190C99B8|nr:biliverdin-producing heme oxygenase [Streptomyces sp. MBT65]MBK3573209.1 biliverdin-producing heme oxygenase [Streptomyces sp. MBT65]